MADDKFIPDNSYDVHRASRNSYNEGIDLDDPMVKRNIYRVKLSRGDRIMSKSKKAVLITITILIFWLVGYTVISTLYKSVRFAGVGYGMTYDEVIEVARNRQNLATYGGVTYFYYSEGDVTALITVKYKNEKVNKISMRTVKSGKLAVSNDDVFRKLKEGLTLHEVIKKTGVLPESGNFYFPINNTLQHGIGKNYQFTFISHSGTPFVIRFYEYPEGVTTVRNVYEGKAITDGEHKDIYYIYELSSMLYKIPYGINNQIGLALTGKGTDDDLAKIEPEMSLHEAFATAGMLPESEEIVVKYSEHNYIFTSTSGTKYIVECCRKPESDQFWVKDVRKADS